MKKRKSGKNYIKFFLCFFFALFLFIIPKSVQAAGGDMGGKECDYEINQIYLEGNNLHIKGWMYRNFENYTSGNHNYYVRVRSRSTGAYVGGTYWDLNDYYVSHTDLNWAEGNNKNYYFDDVGFHFSIPVSTLLDGGYSSYKFEVHLQRGSNDWGKYVSYITPNKSISNDGYTITFNGTSQTSGFYVDASIAYVRSAPSKTSQIVKHGNGQPLYWEEYDTYSFANGTIVDSFIEPTSKSTWFKCRIVDGGRTQSSYNGLWQWRARPSSTGNKYGWITSAFLEYATDDFYVDIRRNNYTYSFDANGGSRAPGPETKQHGAAFTFPTKVPTRDGYSFAGWSQYANGGGSRFLAGKTYSGLPDENKTFYATWVNNPPEITIPVLPEERPDVPSNIPPFIDNDMVIVQKGDPVDPTDYVEVIDKEDGNISDRVVIESNPIPYDKNGNTTKAGTYEVVVSVTDNGGTKVKGIVTVLVNEKPRIQASNRYFYLNTNVDKTEILKQTSSIDYEDGDITNKINIISIKDKDGKELAKDKIDTSKVADYIITYKVTDKYKASNTAKAVFTILDKNVNVDSYTDIRYISKKYLNTLDSNSNWKTDSSLNQKLVQALNKPATDNEALYVIEFNAQENEAMKNYILNNPQDENFNRKFINQFNNIFVKKPTD